MITPGSSVCGQSGKERKSDSGFRSGKADFEPHHNSFQMLYKAEDNVEGFLLECRSKLLAQESKSWLDIVS